MRLENYPEEKLKKEIKEVFERYLDLKQYRLFVFGSRVSGAGDEHSDVDIGIEGTKEISFEKMAKIKEEINNLPTLYKIEVIDFAKTSAEFKEIALRYTEDII